MDISLDMDLVEQSKKRLLNPYDYFDIYSQSLKTTMLEYHNKQLNQFIIQESSGIGVYRSCEDTEHYSFVEEIGADALNKLCRQEGIPSGKKSVVNRSIFYDRPLSLDFTVIGQSIVDYVTNRIEIRIKSKVHTTFQIQFVTNHRHIANSASREHQLCDSTIVVKIYALSTEQHASLVQCNLLLDQRWNMTKIIQRCDVAVRKLIAMMHCQVQGRELSTGRYDIILSGADAGIMIHEVLGHPLELDSVRGGRGIFSDAIGKKISSSECTIIDDGNQHIPGVNQAFDDELTPSQKTILVNQGVVRGYLSCRKTANKTSYPLTGNGRRESFRHSPIPRMTTTYLAQGPHNKNALISELKTGLICRSFYSGKVNIIDGSFIFYPAEAYWVKNGKIQHPLKNVAIHGNALDLLNKIDGVGNDLTFSKEHWLCSKGQHVQVGIGSPTVLIRGLSVGVKL
ncbi:TldD/PmbA family protein [Alteromonas sp. BMJM2]|uniref:TldD/PmbA family protein n=1 Tax=Alteromonas sp. BMJM2 TaxID=2954241 RepID=UPI0022B49818|nr:TldD/PmbA family protein [Alteromonas sp. BMJM2]